MVQCTGETPGETQEESGREELHSARNLCAPEAPGQSKSSEQRQIKWPPTSKLEAWHQFDEDVSTVLETTSKGNADRRLRCITIAMTRC